VFHEQAEEGWGRKARCEPSKLARCDESEVAAV